jgi:hypothetical protein
MQHPYKVADFPVSLYLDFEIPFFAFWIITVELCLIPAQITARDKKRENYHDFHANSDRLRL